MRSILIFALRALGLMPPQTPRLSPPRLARFNIAIGISFLLVLALPLAASAYGVGTPIASDSRIKTFVYNENDVYRLLTHYGYQMNIEFGNKEEIETIAVADRTGWQIIPAGNRLFVRGMEDKAHTNMTVVTNRHAYQFDLYSAPPGEQGWDELVYVVRFYYPEEQDIQAAALGGGMATMPAYSGGGAAYAMPPAGMSYGTPSATQMPYNPAAYGAVPQGSSPISLTTSDVTYQAQPQPQMMPQPLPQPVLMQPQPQQMAPAPLQQSIPAGNFNYSFTGEQSILPTQMFDDGRRTTLVFTPNQMTPQITVVTPAGSEQTVAMNVAGQTVTLDGVYARMVLRVGGSQACIYNENIVAANGR